jgi:hypothetical protein
MIDQVGDRNRLTIGRGWRNYTNRASVGTEASMGFGECRIYGRLPTIAGVWYLQAKYDHEP